MIVEAIQQCPALPLRGTPQISAILSVVDCQADAAIATTYVRLFGPTGGLDTILTAMLTLYIVVLGFGLMMGRSRMTLPQLGPRVLVIGLVLSFATAWPAYQSVVVDLLTQGPDRIAGVMLGEPASSDVTNLFASKLDQVAAFTHQTASVIEQLGGQSPTGAAAALPLAGVDPSIPTLVPAKAAATLRSSGTILLASTAGVLIVARLALGLILAMGPVFVVLGLFSVTRGLFEGWLRAGLAFAFVPLFVIISGSAVLNFLSPAMSAIARDPLLALEGQQSVTLMMAGAVMYAILLAVMLIACFFIAFSFKLGLGGGRGLDRRSEGNADVRIDLRNANVADSRVLVTGSGDGNNGGGGGEANSSGSRSDPRIHSLAQSLLVSASVTDPNRSSGGSGRVADVRASLARGRISEDARLKAPGTKAK